MEEYRKISAIITPRKIETFPTGIYKGNVNDLLFYSYSNPSAWNSSDEDNIKGMLNFPLSKENNSVIQRVYLHLGVAAVPFAQTLSGEASKLAFITCKCDRMAKQDFARGKTDRIYWSECGAKDTLQRFAQWELDKL
ncbi:MAG: hypothetical protein Q7S74_04760 [Nanoarchaeota archaeon]|nr:hypothetical protein [Nanoarchaeota archaeon]